MVSLNTTLCPSSLSQPSVPKGHYGTSGDVPWCPSTQFTVPLVHPTPQTPRGIMGQQGMSHGVPQHNSLSHLSISTLSFKRDVRNVKGRHVSNLKYLRDRNGGAH